MRLCLEALYLQLSCRGILDERYRVNGKLVKANRSLGGIGDSMAERKGRDVKVNRIQKIKHIGGRLLFHQCFGRSDGDGDHHDETNERRLQLSEAALCG